MKKLMLFEFAQNLPVLVGFVAAWHFWQGGELAAAGVCLVAGGLGGALGICITEPFMVQGHRETTRALVGNAASFVVLMALLVLYLSAGWSAWYTDVGAGMLAALALAVAQDFVSEEQMGLARSLWLGLSGSVGLILLRWLTPFSALAAIVIVTVWITLVMGTSYLDEPA
jgi:hypothetical protein